MEKVSTAQIIVRKALQRPCGQECVDWAVNMLIQNFDGYFLRILAGMEAPFNHFELAELQNKAFRELGFSEISTIEAVQNFAAELLEDAFQNGSNIHEVVKQLRDLCIELDYFHEIYDFYLLYYAYSDLQYSEEQFYWPDATSANIDSIIRVYAEEFIRKFKAAQ